VPLLPASHLVFNVGFFLAERTLLVPSAGAALLAALAARRVAVAAVAACASAPDNDASQSPPARQPKPPPGPGRRLGKRRGPPAAVTLAAAAALAASAAVVAALAQRSSARSFEWAREASLYASGLRALPHAPSLLYSVANLKWAALKAAKQAQQQQGVQARWAEGAGSGAAADEAAALITREAALEADAAALFWRTLEVRACVGLFS
jgi:hypothetical protein